MVHKLKLEDKPMEIESLEHHILICGWNRQAISVVEQLQSDKTERERAIVIIAEMEKQPIFDTHIVNTDLIFFIQGDCTNIDVLKKARVEKADKAIILADKSKPRSDQDRDARTVLTALTIEKLNPKIFTCAELLNRDNEVHLRMAGVEEVVVGDEYTANILATVTINQGIVKLLDELFSTKYGNQFIKVTIPESFSDMTFIDFSNFLKKAYDSILVAVEQINSDGKYELHTNPPSDFKIKANDKLIVITGKQILSLKK
jgi:voltage-gated potassium channel